MSALLTWYGQQQCNDPGFVLLHIKLVAHSPVSRKSIQLAAHDDVETYCSVQSVLQGGELLVGSVCMSCIHAATDVIVHL